MVGFLDDLIGNIDIEEEEKDKIDKKGEHDYSHEEHQDEHEESLDKGGKDLSKSLYSDKFYQWCKTGRLP